jgi:hypothetical protein
MHVVLNYMISFHDKLSSMSTNYCITPIKRGEIQQFNFVKLSSAIVILYTVDILPQEKKDGRILKQKNS